MTIVRSQKLLCTRFNTEFMGCDLNLNIGIALESLNKDPLHAVRYIQTCGSSGWYFWGGELSSDPDFFQQLSAIYLDKYCPQVLPYLGLKTGYRFIIDRNGYEDVWLDHSINTGT